MMTDLTDNTLISMMYTHLAMIKKLVRELRELKVEARKRGFL
jgi:hypothetical protein